MKTYSYFYRGLALFSLLFIFQTQEAFSEKREKPNILFILGDDINRDQLGAFGGDAKTPHLNQLVKDGVNFTRAYSHTAMCAPFRNELYSGRSPWTTGTMMNHSRAMEGTRSLPHYLKPLGYKVGLIGKRHIGSAESYPFDYLGGGEDVKKDNNEEFIEIAKTYISSSLKEDAPFCLFIASHDGHGPYSTGDRSVYERSALRVPPYWKDTPYLRAGLRNHLAEITNLDALLGQLRAFLKEEGLEKDTLVFYCSEQGTSFPFAKFSCYDNGVHTALVAAMPRVIPAGHIVDEFIQVIDIAPSIVEAAGGVFEENGKDFDGVSQWDNFTGENTKKHEYVYAAFNNKGIIGSMDRIFPIRSIRDKRYTLIWNPNYTHYTSNVGLDSAYELLTTGTSDAIHGGTARQFVEYADDPQNPLNDPLIKRLHHRPEYELYDRQEDPYELTNLYGAPAMKQTQSRLMKNLESFLNKNQDTDPIEYDKKLNPKSVKY